MASRAPSVPITICCRDSVGFLDARDNVLARDEAVGLAEWIDSKRA
jgi:hypothetical protein